MTEIVFYWPLQLAISIAVIIRILLRPHREPASRIAWVVVVATLPVVGLLAYLLLGEVNIGRRHYRAMRKVRKELPVSVAAAEGDPPQPCTAIPRLYAHLFRAGQSISGLAPAGSCARNDGIACKASRRPERSRGLAVRSAMREVTRSMS